MKTCSKCKETKPLEAFSNCKSKKDGLRSWCKSCDKSSRISRSKANPEKVKAQKSAWNKANPEKVRAQKSAWVKANPEKHRAHYMRWSHANLEKQRAASAMRCENMTPGYIATALGMRAQTLTPELLEAKRFQIEIHRLMQSLNEALKENHDD